MEHADAVAAGGSLLHHAGHELQRQHGGIIFRLGIGDAELARAGGAERNQDGGLGRDRRPKIHV